MILEGVEAELEHSVVGGDGVRIVPLCMLSDGLTRVRKSTDAGKSKTTRKTQARTSKPTSRPTDLQIHRHTVPQINCLPVCIVALIESAPGFVELVGELHRVSLADRNKDANKRTTRVCFFP